MAEGWIERQGKSTCFAEAQLKDQAGNVIAKATSTMRLVSQAKVADGSRASGPCARPQWAGTRASGTGAGASCLASQSPVDSF